MHLPLQTVRIYASGYLIPHAPPYFDITWQVRRGGFLWSSARIREIVEDHEILNLQLSLGATKQEEGGRPAAKRRRNDGICRRQEG